MAPTKRDQALAAARLAVEMAAPDLTKASVNGWVAKELLDEIDELTELRAAVRDFLDSPLHSRGYNEATERMINALDAHEKRLDEQRTTRAAS